MFKLPCAAACPSLSVKYRATHKPRFHITCLWCRTRRKRVLTRYIQYGYLSLAKSAAWGYKFDYANKLVYQIPIWIPQLLMIDPAGHFTALRCAAIVALDKLMFKLNIRGSHLFANVCEFLANYPIW